MGAKSPDGHRQNFDADTSQLKPAQPAIKGSGNGSQMADLDRGIVNEGGDDDDDEQTAADGPGVSGAALEKKKKKKAKKISKAKKTKSAQTAPPRILVATLFPTAEYPAGELIPYESLKRTTEEERRYDSRKWDDDFFADYRPRLGQLHSSPRRSHS